MKKALLIIFIVAMSLVFLGQYNNNPRVIIARVFKEGGLAAGNLKYRIYFLGLIPIGEAELTAPEVKDYAGRKVYHLKGRADTLKFYSGFYQADAEVDSYVDIKTLNPFLFKQRLSVLGKGDIHKEASYDQENGIMTIAGVKRQIFPDTQDPLSAMFRIKQMNFAQVRDFQIGLNTNQKNYILKGSARSGVLKINKADRQVAFLEGLISRRDKNPYHKSSIRMVLLREEENIPVLIRVFASGALIYARLTDIK